MFTGFVLYIRSGLRNIKIKASGVLTIVIDTLLLSSSILVEVMNIDSINHNSSISYPLDCSQDGATGLVRF